MVLKEVNNICIDIDSYCCRITIKRVDRTRPVTVGHVPRELSRFIFYFIQEEGLVTGTVASTTPRISPNHEGGLEVQILMRFTHENKATSSKMEILVRQQVQKMKKNFWYRDISQRKLSWKLFQRKPYVCRTRWRKVRKRTSWRRFYSRSRIRRRRKKCNCNWLIRMIEKKNRENRENNRKKISSGCFTFLNNG